MKYQNTLDYAQQKDKEDKLSYLREQFHIPKDKDGSDWLVFYWKFSRITTKRNSKNIFNQELEDWANYGVEGHFEAKNPWMPYHEFLTEHLWLKSLEQNH